ncbi:MAG: relaxase/mobilization nuclease domain-containing protein, partial [Firmicutes bacterium]|nr:relaxase/mobilization nuclease domain-containing protein [Bacillota bacterium]
MRCSAFPTEDGSRCHFLMEHRKNRPAGTYSFIVATHTDRAHIHNHIVFNSTAMDGSRKFRNFYFSGLALQKISDLVCMEHNLSVIESVPYDERKKRTEFPEKT